MKQRFNFLRNVVLFVYEYFQIEIYTENDSRGQENVQAAADQEKAAKLKDELEKLKV